MSVGVVGTGYWGKNILRNLAALEALGGFCDVGSEARARSSANHPDIPAFADPEALLATAGIDAVAIATPAATHGALVRQALDAGKHVFVEKPLCLDLREAEDLGRRAQQAGRVLMIGHLLLYHPAFRAVAGLVRAGGVGPLRYIYSNRLSLGKIRREENALWSFAPHDISMILALAGRMPESVTATGGHYLADGVADTTLSHLTFTDELQAHVFVSWLHPYKDHRLVVVGQKGMVAFNDVREGDEKVLLYRHDLGWDGDIPVVSRAEAEPVPYGRDEPLRLECRAFLDAIAGRARPPSDAGEGLRVLKVLHACQQAIATATRVRL